MTKRDKQIVEGIVMILRYYIHLGPEKLAKLLTIAYEREVGYAMHRTRSKTRQTTRT